MNRGASEGASATVNPATTDPQPYYSLRHVIRPSQLRNLGLPSTPLYVAELVQESELVVRQTGAALGERIPSSSERSPLHR